LVGYIQPLLIETPQQLLSLLGKIRSF